MATKERLPRRGANGISDCQSCQLKPVLRFEKILTRWPGLKLRYYNPIILRWPLPDASALKIFVISGLTRNPGF